MPYTYQDKRYSRSNITLFVEKQRDLIEAKPSVSSHHNFESVFKDLPQQPEGPVDLLYYFNDERQTPALGFQQVDDEQDEDEMYALVYIDPSLKQEWQS